MEAISFQRAWLRAGWATTQVLSREPAVCVCSTNMNEPLSWGGRYNGETDSHEQAAVQKPIKQGMGELRVKFSEEQGHGESFRK